MLIDRQKDKETGGHADRQKDKQRGGHADRQKDRQKDRQTKLLLIFSHSALLVFFLLSAKPLCYRQTGNSDVKNLSQINQVRTKIS